MNVLCLAFLVLIPYGDVEEAFEVPALDEDVSFAVSRLGILLDNNKDLKDHLIVPFDLSLTGGDDNAR